MGAFRGTGSGCLDAGPFFWSSSGLSVVEGGRLGDSRAVRPASLDESCGG